MAEILIIDDEPNYCGMLAELVGLLGHRATFRSTLKAGLETALSGSFDVVFLDINLPDGSGLSIIPKLADSPQSPEVIIVTGCDDTKSAELALQSGAWDYVRKGSSNRDLQLSLSRALQYRESRGGTARYIAFNAPEIIGHAPALHAALNTAARAAAGDVNVLVTGETGTGKELFATAIHENSPRAHAPFVVVDCAALPESLVESVLFGHVRGAFTGAEHDREGLIKQANGGTLFLDEVGDMPMELQKAFLRVLQERRFRPIGSEKTQASDFRLIAATNRDLESLVTAGAFRRDLLYRLRAVCLPLPPMKERMEDIPLLTTHFVTRHCRALGRSIKGISEGFSEALQGYHWPGNVRELAHAIAAAITTAGQDPTLYPYHLPLHIRTCLVQNGIDGAAIAQEDGPEPPTDTGTFALAGDLAPMKQMRAHFEKAYLEKLVSQAGGDIETACRVSGVSRPHVYALLKKYGLKL